MKSQSGKAISVRGQTQVFTEYKSGVLPTFRYAQFEHVTSRSSVKKHEGTVLTKP